MHKLNVLALGPNNFISTLKELKSFLKFNLFDGINNINKTSNTIYDILLFHEQTLDNLQNKDIINNFSSIKILATDTKPKKSVYNGILKLPTTVNEINSIIESCAVKKTFNENSSIKIKNYLLNKNEKKLVKEDLTIFLTEKEIQLLELFLNIKTPISKNKILSLIWHYAPDADTHTVETHIYRLRKKINDKFGDENFISNNKEGYYF